MSGASSLGIAFDKHWFFRLIGRGCFRLPFNSECSMIWQHDFFGRSDCHSAAVDCFCSE